MKSNPNRFWWTVFALGWAFDFLFWEKAPGINIALYVVLCLAAGIWLLRADGHYPKRNTIYVLPLIAIFSVITFLRQEPMTVFLSIVLIIFLMGVFALGLREIADSDKIGLMSFSLFVLGAISLLGVGVFPITERPYHWYFSVAFFVFMPLSMFSYAVYLYRGGMQNLGKMSASMGLVAALIWVPSWDGVAIPETISALAYAFWAQFLGVLMIQTPLDEEQAS